MAKVSLSYPDTWLTISISVLDRATAIVSFTWTMTEVDSTRVYKYDFTEVANTDYVYVATCTGYNNMTGTIYYTSSSGWLTTEEHDRLFTLPTSAGGGLSSQSIKTAIGNSNRELEKKIETEHEKTREIIIRENNSNIDSAKNNIIDTIESIETAESVLEEKEAKKAIKILTILDKKISGYIDSEMSDKEELGAIAKQFSKIEMEEVMKEKQKEIEHKKMMEEKQKMEEEEDKKLLEEIKLEFIKAEEKDKEEKRKELEKELEETLKEAEELKKELKTI